MNVVGDVAPAIENGKPLDIDEAILTAWRTRRLDTVDIAKAIGKPQSFVAGRLAVLRDAGADER